MTHTINETIVAANPQAQVIEDKLALIFTERFSELLKSRVADKKTFDAMIVLFNKFSLLTLRQPSMFTPKPLELDQSKLDNGAYRRRMAKKLLAPRPGPYVWHTFRIDPSRVHEPEYAQAFADFMARKMIARLSPLSQAEASALVQLSGDELLRFFDCHKAFELTAANILNYQLRQFALQALDNNPQYQAACAAIRKAADEARAIFQAEWSVFKEKWLAEEEAGRNAILAKVDADCDRYLAELEERRTARQEIERREQSERDAIAARNFGKSEQDLFRESVMERERQHREANKLSPRARFVAWSAGLLLLAGAAFFVEVEGVTAVDYLRSWFE